MAPAILDGHLHKIRHVVALPRGGYTVAYRHMPIWLASPMRSPKIRRPEAIVPSKMDGASKYQCHASHRKRKRTRAAGSGKLHARIVPYAYLPRSGFLPSDPIIAAILYYFSR